MALLLPGTSWRPFTSGVVTSNVDMENCVHVEICMLAHNRIDDMASEYAASSVQYFWSFSVEE